MPVYGAAAAEALEERVSENLIEKILCEHIENQRCFFVFPTQMAADLWADRATFVTSVTAVAVERFVAWDRFKSESIRSSHQDKKSVPSAMRQIFAASIIKSNAEKPFLSYIIAEKYSRSAGHFADWISGVLPELALWKRLFDSSGKAPDDEDKDYLQLYERYSAFLEHYGFFDPAWETPPFKPDGNHYFIFFPEILSDYAEYEEILKSSPDITIVNLPEPSSLADVPVSFFNNSRIELKYVASVLMELHEKKKIPWTEIAVNVPDLESYGAYLSRELSLFEIPHVIRNAADLSSTGAGCLFSLIRQCASSGCDYDSLYALLLDAELPWIDMDKNRNLLDFGRENHCICNFEYKGDKINVWDKSFEDTLSCYKEAADDGGVSSGKEKFILMLRGYFRSLRSSIETIAQSSSFEQLRENYFAFRERFFDMTKCPARSDLILSRCVKELGGLIDLEKEYFSSPDALCGVESPFSFFTDYISGIQYLEQTQQNGVQILPYKLGSCAPFACHIIVDASQSSVSVIYDGLRFLTESKRRLLTKREECNCTEQFIQLYMMNSTAHAAYFTAANKTFSGYAQSCSCLKENDMHKETDASVLFGANPYIAEKRWLLSCNDDFLPDGSLFPERVPESAKEGFKKWLDVQPAAPSAEGAENAEHSPSRFDTVPSSGIVCISKTQLKNFFNCPYSWLLKYRFNLEEKDDTATLMNQYAYGNLYHKIFEIFMTSLKDDGLALKIDGSGEVPEQYKALLAKSIDAAIASKDPQKSVYDNCYLSRELLGSAKAAITDKMLTALESFSKVFNGCVVDSVEESFTVRIPDKKYTVTGRIDCLLRDTQNDRLFLVDYKTKKAPENFLLPQNAAGTDNKDEQLPLMRQTLPDFQIPIYLLLLRNAEKKRIVNNACFFIFKENKVVNVFGEEMFHRNPPLSSRSKVVLVKPEVFEPLVEKTVECMDFYAQCVSSGMIETDPEVQNYTRCKVCDYKGLCRKTFNVGRKG